MTDRDTRKTTHVPLIPPDPIAQDELGDEPPGLERIEPTENQHLARVRSQVARQRLTGLPSERLATMSDDDIVHVIRQRNGAAIRVLESAAAYKAALDRWKQAEFEELSAIFAAGPARTAPVRGGFNDGIWMRDEAAPYDPNAN